MRRQMVFDHTGCLEMLDLRLSLSLSGVSGSLLAPTYGSIECADSSGTLPTDPTTTPTSPTSGPAGPGTS